MKNFKDFRPEFTPEMLDELYGGKLVRYFPPITLAENNSHLFTSTIQFWISRERVKNMDELRNRLLDRVLEGELTYDEGVVLNRCAQIQWDEFCEQ